MDRRTTGGGLGPHVRTTRGHLTQSSRVSQYSDLESLRTRPGLIEFCTRSLGEDDGSIQGSWRRCFIRASWRPFMELLPTSRLEKWDPGKRLSLLRKPQFDQSSGPPALPVVKTSVTMRDEISIRAAIVKSICRATKELSSPNHLGGRNSATDLFYSNYCNQMAFWPE